ncbi:hypothetical protein LEP1GSC125_1226 [Leptospira mayottensis 200901122]|uniref:Uncharacterized protein n=1 Tax=Leptospira mayottensis 200901122 TaxID=1193010 RepID=A0AA87SZS8_9LEPT|nr:hypothetical protein LEP1GSC125_1226 [Leptospira mayottensis 200901122]
MNLMYLKTVISFRYHWEKRNKTSKSNLESVQNLKRKQELLYFNVSST